eukprot:TRINITY_DN6906_c0_g1_i1.p1 TRINITY_DN6906_c0_g1~~TRINITY_DN6906_c0_g1_i1.p1  ORF type:complete len:498 (-),score=110.01 TRINITY_DN6906_c0_g1_i1:6-1445(-)
MAPKVRGSGKDHHTHTNNNHSRAPPPPPPVPFRTQPYAKEDEFAEAFYKPHTVTAGLIAIVALTYFAFTRSDSDDSHNIKVGIVVMCASFLWFCFVHLPDGLMLRPHPAVWRVVLGATLIYLLTLVFILFQNIGQARAILGFFDSRLNKPLPERDYAADCRIVTPDHPSGSRFANVVATVKDEFIFAHVAGHWGKAVMIRSWRVCVCISVIFELIEITFQHLLPNYMECWWDHVIVDIIVCNGLGMWLGLKTCEFFAAKKYEWVGLRKLPTYSGKVARLVKQFSPIDWVAYEWEIFVSFKRFLYVSFLAVMFNIVDNNAFFLKFILWLPPTHPLNPARLFLWFFLGTVGIREWYQFMTDPNCKRLGTTAWVLLMVTTVELLIIFKFSSEAQLFAQSPPMPIEIFYPWVAFFVLGLVWIVLYFPTAGLRKRSALWAANLELLWYLIFVPWVFLFLSGCPDLRWGVEWFRDLLVRVGLPVW